MRIVREFAWGYAYVVWNWPVWMFSFMRWNHEESMGVRVRVGFLKMQVLRRKGAA